MWSMCIPAHAVECMISTQLEFDEGSWAYAVECIAWSNIERQQSQLLMRIRVCGVNHEVAYAKRWSIQQALVNLITNWPQITTRKATNTDPVGATHLLVWDRGVDLAGVYHKLLAIFFKGANKSRFHQNKPSAVRTGEYVLLLDGQPCRRGWAAAYASVELDGSEWG